MKPAFIINVRDKENWIYRSVEGALNQTYPCEIIISDQGSTDGTVRNAKWAINECERGAEHQVQLLNCPVNGPKSMEMANANMHWAWQQSSPDCDWIFQSSGDDYSLPDRVKVCMEAIEKNPCSAVATTMFFEKPGETRRDQVSGFPRETGYVKAGEGLLRLAYGSTIGAYHRDFLAKMGDAGPNTPDVLWGYMAALEKGFYVVANPQHVHVQHASTENTGFQGKMLAANGDEALKLAELNHFQLLMVYCACADLCQKFHPQGITEPDWVALVNMIVGQAIGWKNAREVLHQKQIMPGILP